MCVRVKVSPAVTCLAMAQNRFSSQSKDICSPTAKNRKHTETRAALRQTQGKMDSAEAALNILLCLWRKGRWTGNQFDPRFTSVVS